MRRPIASHMICDEGVECPRAPWTQQGTDDLLGPVRARGTERFSGTEQPPTALILKGDWCGVILTDTGGKRIGARRQSLAICRPHVATGAPQKTKKGCTGAVCPLT